MYPYEPHAFIDLARERNLVAAARRITSDAEVEKHTGGMVALRMRQDFAEAMVVEGGEAVEDLHLTLAFLGSDVTDLPHDGVAHAIGALADSHLTAVRARVMGHAIFNPDGGPNGDMDPCCVYLISDSKVLSPLRDAVHEICQQEVPGMPDQHEPFLAHVTASYAVQRLSFTGPIVFDRISLNWAGDQVDFPLLDR